jgi:hypothetical protein
MMEGIIERDKEEVLKTIIIILTIIINIYKSNNKDLHKYRLTLK